MQPKVNIDQITDLIGIAMEVSEASKDQISIFYTPKTSWTFFFYRNGKISKTLNIGLNEGNYDLYETYEDVLTEIHEFAFLDEEIAEANRDKEVAA